MSALRHISYEYPCGCKATGTAPLPTECPQHGRKTVKPSTDQLRAEVVGAALGWQLIVDDHRRGLKEEIEVNAAAVRLYKATRAYRAATR